MTLRYVQVIQQDLQREFRLARQTLAQRHLMPPLPVPSTATQNSCGLPAILQSLTSTRHLLAIYVTGVSNSATQRKLQRLTNRLCKVSSELAQLNLP